MTCTCTDHFIYIIQHASLLASTTTTCPHHPHLPLMFFFPACFFSLLLLPSSAASFSSPIADLNNTSTPNASQGRARSAFKVAAGMPRVGCLLGGSGLFAGTGRAGASSGGSIMTAGRIFPRLAMSTGPAPSQVMYRFQRKNRSQSCYLLFCSVLFLLELLRRLVAALALDVVQHT